MIKTTLRSAVIWSAMLIKLCFAIELTEHPNTTVNTGPASAEYIEQQELTITEHLIDSIGMQETIKNLENSCTKKLIFSGNSFSPDALNRFATFLQDSTSLKKLSFLGTKIGVKWITERVDWIGIILNSLQENKTLEVLSFEDILLIELKELAVKSISNFLRTNTSLNSFTFKKGYLGPKNLQLIFDALGKGPENKELKELDLSENRNSDNESLTPAEINPLCTLLLDPKKVKNLKNLALTANGLTLEASELLVKSVKNRHMDILDIKWNDITYISSQFGIIPSLYKNLNLKKLVFNTWDGSLKSEESVTAKKDHDLISLRNKEIVPFKISTIDFIDVSFIFP